MVFTDFFVAGGAYPGDAAAPAGRAGGARCSSAATSRRSPTPTPTSSRARPAARPPRRARRGLAARRVLAQRGPALRRARAGGGRVGRCASRPGPTPLFRPRGRWSTGAMTTSRSPAFARWVVACAVAEAIGMTAAAARREVGPGRSRTVPVLRVAPGSHSRWWSPAAWWRGRPRDRAGCLAARTLAVALPPFVRGWSPSSWPAWAGRPASAPGVLAGDDGGCRPVGVGCWSAVPPASASVMGPVLGAAQAAVLRRAVRAPVAVGGGEPRGMAARNGGRSSSAPPHRKTTGRPGRWSSSAHSPVPSPARSSGWSVGCGCGPWRADRAAAGGSTGRAGAEYRVPGGVVPVRWKRVQLKRG